VVVAPFPKGPGFSPTIVQSPADLTNLFGAPDGVLYGPYTAQQYLQQQGQVTICRVGGLGGYTQNNALILSAIPGQYDRFIESGSFTGSLVNAILTPTTSASWMQGTLSALFTAGAYSGSTLLAGTISCSISNRGFGPTGNLTSGSITASLINPLLPIDPKIPGITVTASFVVASASPCQNSFVFTGKINGAYGLLNSASWSAYGTSSLDSCGGVTGSGSGSVDEVLLAVLANTALDSGQLLQGFSGSVLTPVAETVNAQYRLALNYSYTDPTTQLLVTGSYGTYNFSLNQQDSAYFTSVFGTDPKAGANGTISGQKVEAAYTYLNFDNTIKNTVALMLASGSYKIKLSTRNLAMTFTDGITANLGDSAFSLSEASTPFVNSHQIFSYSGSSGPTSSAYPLFAVHTLSDGTVTNTLYKLEISNVRSPGSLSNTAYGSFSLTVRDFNDTDARVNIIERYDNLTLDPNDANYIARRIGDMYNYIDFTGKILQFGNFTNVSKFIRVEMATAPWPATAIPFGFGAYATPLGSDYATLGKLPAMQYTEASTYPAQPGRYASGIVFQPAPANADAVLQALYPNGSAIGPELDNRQYFNTIPQGAATFSSKTGNGNQPFDLGVNCGVNPLYDPVNESTNVKKRRFVFGFQGGFDGMSPSVPVLVGDSIIPTNQQGFDCSTNTSSGSIAYAQALAALGNADEWDINLITLPGINYEDHPYVVSTTVDMCESRGDVFYIMDIAPDQAAGDASVDNTVNLAAQFDTNYAATYYPWVKIVDVNTNRIFPVPPSVVMMPVYAANDKLSAEWFAPAGLNRGGIPQAVQVMDRLTHIERDTLYEGKVNPIAAFPGQGIVAWGQKTLQRQASALDRVNVRRLMIALKKFISSSGRFLLFENNVSTTRQRFLNIVNPYMESVQQRSGLYSFQVKMDAENNTPDIIDRNILYGQIWVQPSKTAEFLVIDFTLTPSGASFSG
jgi:Phage tail sheath protein subtilisin-like domain/Phage tail sheath C-terminal domain